MSTMAALRAHRRGGPEELTYEQVPVPRIARDEVLVAVHAAAITFDELVWDETWRRIPVIPSHEFSGVVAAIGEEASRFTVGDEVYGLIGFDRDGAAAEFAAVPEKDIALRPMSVSHVEAAALPLAGLTAWQALIDHARLQPGERVLVLGGAGGVGVFVVQLARGLGAEVTATVRSRAAADAVAHLGAHHVVDVSRGLLQATDFDVVVDTVGGEALDAAYALLRPYGRLITLQAPPSPERAAERRIDARFFIVQPDRRELTELAGEVDRGRLTVPIAAVFPLRSGREAFESRTRRTGPGKTVLLVRS